MSGRRKTKEYRPKPFESKSDKVGARFETEQGKTLPNTYTALFLTMLMSPAFRDLSDKNKILYLYCKAQYYGVRKPKQDFPDNPDMQGDDLFYFSRQTAVDFGWCKKNDTKPLYQGLNILVEHGFIEKVVSGKANHRKSIYRYSDRWQDWKEQKP